MERQLRDQRCRNVIFIEGPELPRMSFHHAQRHFAALQNSMCSPPDVAAAETDDAVCINRLTEGTEQRSSP